MSPVLLHSVHAALLALACVGVAALLLPTRPRSVDVLPTATAHGALVSLAEARARRTLARRERPRLALLGFVGATLLAGVVHGAVGPQHFADGLRFGLFFLLVTVAQFGLALAAARGQARSVLNASVAVNAGCVALWLLTRTVGLPLGLAGVQPVGLWDTVASLAEVVALGAALRLRPRSTFALVSVRVPTGV